jgi:hypothetical protein
MKTHWPITTLLVLVSMWGCGGGGGGGAGYKELKLAPASGVVKLNGKPVENPVVTFYPAEGPSSVGVGNEQGEFTLKTNGQNGVSIGKCKVTVTSGSSGAAIPPSDGNEMKLVKNKGKLNPKYASVDKTDLIVEIPEAGNKNLVLDLDE